MKSALYLISLAVGYWVLRTAEGDKGKIQKIGRWIGWVIVIASAGGFLCTTLYRWCAWQSGSKAYCPISSRMCPVSKPSQADVAVPSKG